MDPAKAIRKLGFRRWYERRLIEAHLYLVTGLLSMFLALACVEAASFGKAPLKAVLLVLVAAAAGGGAVLSLRRFLSTLFQAVRLSEASVCKQCGTYGRYEVLAHGADRERVPATDHGLEQQWLRVRCRSCRHEWLIE